MTTNMEREKNSKSKQNQTGDDEFDDEDGGLKPNVRSKTTKKIPKQQKPTSTTTRTDEEDEDGSFNSNRRKEPTQKNKDKKVKKDEPEKKKPLNILEDFDDEDGALTKPKNKIKETKSKKKSMFVQCFQDQHVDHVPAQPKPIKTRVLSIEVDEDGGPIVKTYDTIKKMILPKQPTLKSSSTNDTPSSDQISDKITQSAPPLTHVDEIVVEQKTKPNDADPISIEETTTTKSRKSFPTKLHLIRRKSYEEAQQNSSLLVPQLSNHSISPSDQNNKNTDHENHHWEMKTKKIRMFINFLSPAIGQSTQQETSVDKQLQQRRKRAQTRWYLAYTIIRNPSLRELRKEYLRQLRHQSAAITTLETLTSERMNAMKTPSPSSIKQQQTRTCHTMTEESTSKIEVLKQENIHSSVVYTQTTRTRRVQQRLINE